MGKSNEGSTPAPVVEEDEGGYFAVGAVLGLAAGALLGLLFAPKPGAETRAQIMAHRDALMDKVGDARGEPAGDVELTRVYAPRVSTVTIVSGAIGGVLAAVAAFVVLALLSARHSPSVLVPANAVGAWAVRWLQGAEADAFTHLYVDATLVGVITPALVGAVCGAAFAAVLDRLPRDHPAAWGVAAGLGLWAISWWRMLPALDPALTDQVTAAEWLATCMVFGGVLGAWVQGDRVARLREDAVGAGSLA